MRLFVPSWNLYFGVHRNGFGAGIHRVDDVGVFLVHHAAADLSRARKLVIIGVQLLVEEYEIADARMLGQGRVHPRHLAGQQLQHLRARTQIRVGGERDALALGPFAHDGEADAEHGREMRPTIAQHHRFRDVGAEFQLDLDELRAEAQALAGGGDVLHPVDHHQLPALVEIAGITGMHPSLTHIAGIGHAVIAHEHVGVAGQDLAHPVLVRLLHPQLDLRVEGHAHGVEIHLARLVQGIGAQQFGLAVELAHRHAHGLEEPECVRPQRGTAGGGRAQAGEPQPVAQRAEGEEIREPRMPAALHCRQPTGHAELIHPPLQRAGIEHARTHIGGNRLPHSRREKHESGTYLAEIGHHRCRFLNEIHPHPGDQAPAQDVDLLHDPGQRQDADVIILRPLGVDRQIGLAVPHQRARAQHGKLGPRRGAGGGAEHRHRIRVLRRQQRIIGAGVRRLAQRHQILGRDQPRILQLPHPPLIREDDVAQRRQIGREQLVHLLLILGEDGHGAREGQQILHLLIQSVAIQADRLAAQRMGRDPAHHPIRPVVADQAHHLAARHTQRGQAQGKEPRAAVIFGPCDAAPDAELLLAQRDLRAVLAGVARQDLRQGGRHASAGSATSSSASPR